MTMVDSPAGLDAGRTSEVRSAEQLLPDHPSGFAVWGETDNSTLVCRQVQEVTHDVRTFLFEPSRPALFHFEPGQFVTLHLQIDGRSVSRCYTISTPPTRPHLLGITVKRQPGGLVSNWLHDTMRPGQRISAEGPFGVFTIARRPAGKYLFLSGGSGITPVMSMTRTLYDLGSDADVVFVHSARTPSDIIFRRELETIASTAPTVRVVPVCERDTPGEPWGGLRGFLGVEMLHLLVPDLAERVVFCCGPAPYMAAVRQMLSETGFDMQNYCEESFSFEDLTMKEFSAHATTDLAADEPGAGSAETRTYSIEFVRSGRVIVCAEDENVLDAAYAAGLTPMSSCGQGMCGTCKTTMLSGVVDMQHNGGIRPREIARNKVLICCSKPLSDLTIDA
ncbi:hybrid-cluster NAD(P)-dependent oxidoreductase [Pseudonocardia halophobica]|uniref:Hybrid-cluster NAD(P)-dependent oxidoreductase n=1 Tax=Pseudonocardia halophobica TaxID=29401 RepID=A0A9W6NUE6_9PSEU|nr:hybrid-cluster NAD(P)-dependent oxidoreductase [Pseudonocardia halophobica]GLL09704.1 hybrid-cluster NAD(P)-dependent oxidoreductase [Pseudonocardia halophobica]